MKRAMALLLALLLMNLLISGCAEKEVVDGTYLIEAALSGGSGRAGIESATVVVDKGCYVATIIWGSPFYEYMTVDGVRYEPIQETGNSTFKFPIRLDEDISVSASTVAMSQPHLIDYTLHFDSSTLKEE